MPTRCKNERWAERLQAIKEIKELNMGRATSAHYEMEKDAALSEASLHTLGTN
jgi:hypothetical protein